MSENTPRIGHDPLPMRRIADDFIRGETPPNQNQYEAELTGDFYWLIDELKRRRLVLATPRPDWNNSGALHFLMCEWNIGYLNSNGAQWTWDDNIDQPTLTPSLHWIGVWHGYVRNGQLVEA